MWLAAGVLSAAAGAGLLLRSQYEREQLSVERTEILTEKITRDCRMVFLSDLHDHEFGDHNKRLLHAVDPDRGRHDGQQGKRGSAGIPGTDRGTDETRPRLLRQWKS